MKKLLYILLGALLMASGTAYAAVSLFKVQQGGTGVGTIGASQLIYGNGTNPVASAATTSVTCTGSTTCTPFTVIGPSPITITSSGGSGSAPAFDPAAYGASTSTTIGFLNGLFSTASSTFSGPFRLPALSNGGLAVIGGLVSSGATTTAGTGLTYSGNAFNVNTSQNIATLSNLTTNGLVTTSGSNGTLGVTVNGTNGLILAMSGGIPTWVATTTFSAPFVYASGNVTCTSASAGVTGCLTGADWSTFNGKQAAGNYITALTGDITASGPGSVAATLATVNGNVGSFTNANVTVNAKGLVTAASNGTAGLTSYDAFTHSTINTPNSATTTKIAIGTTTPYYSFTVASSTGAQVALSDGITGDPQITLRNAGGNLYTATTTVAGTATTSTSAFTILGASGFTGIGTSTPTASLDIFAGSQTAPYLSIGSTTAPILSVGPSATTQVAIGTTTPWRTLSIVGTVAINGLTSVGGKNYLCIDSVTKEVVDAGSTTSCALSSGFTKDIIQKITPEVAKYIVDRMNAIAFNYKGETEQHYGFIAEEAAKIDADVKAKFGVDAHLAEYANADVNMKLGDGTYHFFKKGDPINFQYPNYTAVLTVYLQAQQNNFDQKINDQNKLIQNLIDAVKLIVQLKK